MTARAMSTAREVEIVMLHASPIHRYEGRPRAGALPAVGPEVHRELHFRAGLGIVGDRHFNARAHRQASVTLFAIESLEHVAEQLGTPPLDVTATRRNIIVRGLDADSLRGVDFTLDTGAGPVKFRGHRPCNPCAWMDVELADGAFRELRGRGGMRCEPLSDGILHVGPATFSVIDR